MKTITIVRFAALSYFCLNLMGLQALSSVEKINICSDNSSFFINKAKHLLEWNRQMLRSDSKLTLEDISEVFAPKFVVIANGREYHADYQSYYDFLTQFRSDIVSINYQVQEYFSSGSSVFMPLVTTVKRLQGQEDIFDVILFLKFDSSGSGKIIHWQEVYALRTS